MLTNRCSPMSYYNSTSACILTLLLWVNYLLSIEVCELGCRQLEHTVKPTSQTLKQRWMFVCLLRVLGGWMHSFSSHLHTQSSVRDLFTQPGARANKHSQLTYITATCPGRHWSLSHITRTKTEGKQYTTIKKHINCQTGSLWTSMKVKYNASKQS